MIIKITTKAKKQIGKLPQITRIAIVKKIREMVEERENVQVKKMGGYEDMYRVRVGNYRIVYQQDKNVIKIVVVQHRKDVYKRKFQ